MKNVLITGLLLVTTILTIAQTTVITDSITYNAKGSAVLDVQSVHKGLLVPRMTNGQREAIVSPANGLLVYDTSDDSFYVYTSGAWQSISTEKLWLSNNDSIYVTGNINTVVIRQP